MNTLSRRAAVRAVLMLPVGLMGCTFLQKVADTDVTKVTGDLSTISGAVTAVKNTISGISLIPAKVKEAVIAAIDKAKAAATSAIGVASTVASQPFVLQIEDSLKAALEYGKGLLPTTASGALSDALTVLSALKPLIGLASLIPLAGDPGAVDAARGRLQAAAARGAV